MVSADRTACKNKVDVEKQRKTTLWPFKAAEKLPPRNHQGCVPFSPVLSQRAVTLLLAFLWADFLSIDFMTFQLLSVSLPHWQLYKDQLYGQRLENVYIFGSFRVRWVHKILRARWWYNFSPLAALYFTGQINAAAQRIGRVQATELAFSVHFYS